MVRLCSWLGLCCALFAAAPVPAAAPFPRQRFFGAEEMARRIDRHLADAWKKSGVVPAAPADDAEWLRRVYLDLAGRIPSVHEARAFLADRRPDRRGRLVEKLLDGPRFVTHFSAVWSVLLLPEAAANIQIRFQAPAFERRIQEWLRSGSGVDAFVRDLLTSSVGGDSLEELYGVGSSPLATFYAGKEYKPEEIASAVSRSFLGVNIGCAQCHNHPFAAWKRDQFWSFAAFFSGIRSSRLADFAIPEPEVIDSHTLTLPGSDRKLEATYLDGKKAKIRPGQNTRRALADWVVARDNPYFAKAIVNRTWAYFFGTGLHEPLDEMVGTQGATSHPALLDELARGFSEHGYDLRWLMRAVTATRAYALTSRRSHPSQDDPTAFARAALRGLTAHQLFDSLSLATGYRPGDPSYSYNQGTSSNRAQFAARFANTTDRPTEAQTSILQALTLMNGRVMTDSTNVQESETLAAVVDAPFLSLPGKIEALYLAALSRKPTARELTRLAAYVAQSQADATKSAVEKSPEKGEAAALADIFWALLNSGEFYLNH